MNQYNSHSTVCELQMKALDEAVHKQLVKPEDVKQYLHTLSNTLF